MKKLITATLLVTTALLSNHAFAWGAVAVADWGGSYISYDEASPEDAKATAMRGCMAKTSSRCHLAAEAVQRTAMVLAASPTAYMLHADPNPIKAARTALNLCNESYGNCHIIDAAWDSGMPWWVEAKSNEASHISYGANTQKSAEEEAIAGCQKESSPDDKCTVSQVGKGRTFFVDVKAADRVIIAWSAISFAEATAYAVKRCKEKKSRAATCTVIDTYENPGPLPAPASMKQVLAEVAKHKAVRADAR